MGVDPRRFKGADNGLALQNPCFSLRFLHALAIQWGSTLGVVKVSVKLPTTAWPYKILAFPSVSLRFGHSMGVDRRRLKEECEIPDNRPALQNHCFSYGFTSGPRGEPR